MQLPLSGDFPRSLQNETVTWNGQYQVQTDIKM